MLLFQKDAQGWASDLVLHKAADRKRGVWKASLEPGQVKTTCHGYDLPAGRGARSEANLSLHTSFMSSSPTRMSTYRDCKVCLLASVASCTFRCPSTNSECVCVRGRWELEEELL